MLSQKWRLQIRAINGGCGSFSFKSILNFSATATKKAQIQNADMVNYLLDSLGFSRDAAITTLSKVPHLRPSPEKVDPIVCYFQNLGFSKTQIRSMVSGHPRLLCRNVDKTLVPKLNFFRELGLSGSGLRKVVVQCSDRGLDTFIKPRVLYLRQLLGTDDNVVAVLNRDSTVLKFLDAERVDTNVKLLRNYGMTDDNIVKCITNWPRRFFTLKPGGIKDVLHRVENVLGIPRESAMFRHGVAVLASLDRSKVDEKLGVFRSFGWPESVILKTVRSQPLILTKSAPTIQKVVDFFMNELGCSSDFLGSNPAFLTYSLEKRVKPRNEVLKILKKLNKKKAALSTVLCMSESKFRKCYVLPYKVILPDMCDAYLTKTEIPTIELR
ncbi:OLC1v1005708C1 [Oldenlandia corymbosa var. corymbosa]|uniref:OLC1v1005708C1 n=1 Tax=Oldenlandia corymbosa var. corymbosa TaxID=529605 RepID=A0AAV1DF80_OLDCO|nr:OLC1v1005708C1 [Oldenlandia corymbosa var. corymbosa]